MKRKFFILTITGLTLLFVLFSSCKKKNTVTDNNPPDKPSAPQISVDTSEIGEKVYFTIFADDPDDDSIAFRFDWSNGDTSGWSDFAPSGETISMYHSFHSKGTFYIRAQAKDKQEGLSDWSEPDSVVIQDSTWFMVWTCVTPSAPGLFRTFHSSVVNNNNIWIFGGSSDQRFLNDVWFSSDGLNWVCATESAGWSGRECISSIVFDDKIWVLSGNTGQVHGRQLLNDVWFSSDGSNWVCATESAPWSPRAGHTSVVFGDKIWILGGADRNAGLQDDVWYSNDGINWVCATDSAGWYARGSFTAVVYDNKIWIIGGVTHRDYLLNDVWYSSNGIDWDSLPHPLLPYYWVPEYWINRCGHSTVVFDNKIWILAEHHLDSTGNFLGPSNDVWFSLDTKIREWRCLAYSAPWSRRHYCPSVVFDDKIWVFGGSDGGNDVWYGEIVRGK